MHWMLIIALSLSSCISLARSQHEAGYDHALRKELAELLKSYRLCLQKYEEYPSKAKENCTAYRDALRDLAPPHDRRSIAEMLQRLLERER